MDKQKTRKLERYFEEPVRPRKLTVLACVGAFIALMGFVIWCEYQIRTLRPQRPDGLELGRDEHPVPVITPNVIYNSQRSNLIQQPSTIGSDLTRTPAIAVAEIMESAHAHAPAAMVSKEVREQNYRAGIQAVEREIQKMQIKLKQLDDDLMAWALTENVPPNADGGIQIASPEISQTLHLRDGLREQIAVWEHLVRQERATMLVEFYGDEKLE